MQKALDEYADFMYNNKNKPFPRGFPQINNSPHKDFDVSINCFSFSKHRASKTIIKSTLS